MRGLVSVLLLITQLQPLVGVALCEGLARTEASLMEDGCPMPEVKSDRSSPSAAGLPSGPMLTSADPVHDCVFAEACLNASPALNPAKLAFQSAQPPHDQSFRAVSALHGSDEFPPPIPPPNS